MTTANTKKLADAFSGETNQPLKKLRFRQTKNVKITATQG
jgi:hypothetical protein